MNTIVTLSAQHSSLLPAIHCLAATQQSSECKKKNQCCASSVIAMFIVIKMHTGNISSEKKFRIYIFVFPLKLFFYCAIPVQPFSSLTLCFIYLALKMKIFRQHDVHVLTTRNLPITKALVSAGQHSTTLHIRACPERKPSSRIICHGSPEHCVTCTVRLL